MRNATCRARFRPAAFRPGRLLAGLLFVAASSDVQAVDADNHSGVPEPGRFAVALSYAEDSRREVQEYDNLDEPSDASLERRFIEVAYGLCEAVDVSFRLGQMLWDPQSPNGGVYDYGFAWGFGVRTRFFSAPEQGFEAGAGFQYNHADPDDRPRPGLLTFSGEIEEWQLSLSGAYRRESVLVSAGLRYSQVELIYRHDAPQGVRQGGFEETDQVGLFAGAQYLFGEHVFVAGEARAVDATGFSLSLGYLF